MNKYVITCIREQEVLEPCWSVNEQGEAYISDWIKVMKNHMYNKTVYGVTDIDKYIEHQRKMRPDRAIIHWKPLID
jgi:hypothetical protein